MNRRTAWGLVTMLWAALLLSGCAVGDSSSGGMEMAPMPAQDTVVAEPDREIIRTGSMTVRVDDVRASVSDVERIATTAGGWIAQENVDTAGDSQNADISVRVPAANLDGVMRDIGELGTVIWLSVSAEDVTAQGIDLDARIKALQTSITRLEQLLSQAESTKDLIDIEGELTTRQADLDSLVAQRAALSEAVAMSALTVSLTPTAEAAEWTAPGFLAGLQSGWNAFVAMLAGLVTMAGFLLPFLGLLLVVLIPVLVVVLVLRRRHHR